MGTAEQHRPEAGKGTGKSRLCQDQAEQGGESARRGLREVAQSRSQAPQRVPAGHPPAQTLCLGAQLLRLRVVSRWVACCLHCAGDRRGALASAQLPREIPSVELSASVRGGAPSQRTPGAGSLGFACSPPYQQAAQHLSRDTHSRPPGTASPGTGPGDTAQAGGSAQEACWPRGPAPVCLCCGPFRALVSQKGWVSGSGGLATPQL